MHDLDDYKGQQNYFQLTSVTPCLSLLVKLLVASAIPAESSSSTPMYYPSKELKNDNSNGINLRPILPTFIRDARYQGDARYANNGSADRQRLHTVACFYQDEGRLNHHFTGSPL